MKILYIHGFGSAVDYTSEKYIELSKMGAVTGIAPDYTKGFDRIISELIPPAETSDLLVGTSMGGFIASHLSDRLDKTFVAINPAIEPSESLRKYQGTHKDHYDRTFTLTEEVISTYPSFLPSRSGLVLLDMGDTIISPDKTIDLIEGLMIYEKFEEGSHRFEHIKESIDSIEEFYYFVHISDGMTND